MSTVDSILALLEKWPKWKRLTQSPDRLDALEARLRTLEAKFAAPIGDVCPRCRQPAFQLISSTLDSQLGIVGVSVRTYRCHACNFEETKKTT